jgi:phosphoesterase family protein/centrosomal CEP192-like protein
MISRMKALSGIVTLGLFGLFFTPNRGSAQSSATLPPLGHVVIVVGENAGFSTTYNSSNMPFLTALANGTGTPKTAGIAVNYFADTHPSIGNYEVLAEGQIDTNDDSQTPSSMPLSGDNIANEVQLAGKTWKDYQESTNGCGAFHSGTYYVRHDPLTYYTDVNTESANFVCASTFDSDVSAHTLPNFSWLVPNGYDDGHDSSATAFDNFLKAEVGPLLSSSYFQPGGDVLLIVVFDEDSSGGSCGTSTATGCGGQVEMVAVSPFSLVGFQSSGSYEHENVLRTMAQGLGLSFSGLNAAATAAPMSDFFTTTSAGSVSLSPTSATLTAAVGSSATQAFTVTNGTSASVTVSTPTILPGTLGAEFTETNNCTTLTSGAGTCTVTVKFAPTSTGTATATLSVLTSASATPLTAVLTGATESASLSPTSLSWNSIAVGTSGGVQLSTLSNNGTTTLTISGETISGPPFALGGLGTCGTSLAAGTTCTISVNFSPTTTGTFTGSVTVTDSIGAQTLSLNGTAVSSSGGGSSTDLYVSTMGSDSSGCGAITSPCATIAYASTKASAGMTVHVAAGTYAGSFSTSASGTFASYITYIADTADFSAPVNCAQVAADHGSLSGCAQILSSGSSTWSNSGAFVTIEGFDVTGPPSSCCNGIYTSGNATKIIGNNVHGVQMSNGCSSTGGGAIVVDSTNAQVIGNYVHDNGPYPTACGFYHGLYVGNSPNPSSGAYVANNISFRNSGWGLQMWHSATNETVVNNTFFDNATGGIVVGHGTDASGSNNNTLVNNNIVFNNISSDGGIVEEGVVGTSNSYTDNLVFQNSPVNISLQSTTETVTGTVSANPAFVNFTGDYHLTSTSPAINAGTSATAPSTDFDGNARPGSDGKFDIGAYEFTGTVSGSVTLTPSSLTFPSTTVGIASATQLATLSNTTSSAVTPGIVISGTNAGDFSQTNTCGTSVAATSGSCTITVTFTPTATGTRSATLTSLATTETVSLMGTGASSSTGSVTLSPISVAFGSVNMGSSLTSTTLVTLSNTTSSAVSTGIAINTGPNPGDFSWATSGTTPCGTSLAASSSCTVSVTFTPTATGSRSAFLTSTAAANTVTLSGTEASSSKGSVSLSPNSLTFGSTIVGSTSTAQSTTLSNTTSSAVSPGIALSGTNAGDFAETNTCGTSLAANATCTISITFKPAAAGSATAALTVAGSGSGGPLTVTLSGISADFSVSSNPSSGTVKAGGTVTFTLSIAPEGGFNQTVVLSCTDPASQSTCSVSPTSVTPNGSADSTATVTVTTTASSGIEPRAPEGSSWPLPGTALKWLLPIVLGMLALAKVARQRAHSPLIEPPTSKTNFRRPATGFGLAGTLLMVLAWAACGGGSSPTFSKPGTPAGNYKITLTATSGSLTNTSTVTVTVNP